MFHHLIFCIYFCIFFNQSDFKKDPDCIQPEEYAKIVQDVFEKSATSVKIVFETKDLVETDLTKEPFQRCVVKMKRRRKSE